MPENKAYVEKKVAMSESTYNGLNKLSKQRKNRGEVISKNKDIIAMLVARELKKESK